MARRLLMAIAATLFPLVLLFSCSNSKLGEVSTLDEASALKICKAATATLMGRDVQIMTAEKIKDPGVYHVFYDRPSDNTRWGFLYKFEGDRIIWAGAEMPSGPNGKGRWRTHPLDDKITYSFRNNAITITEVFSDSSSNSRQFNAADIK